MSSGVLDEISVPAFNISKPYSSNDTPAISASSSAAKTSSDVLVGDLSSNVSETIAESIKPAISLGRSEERRVGQEDGDRRGRGRASVATDRNAEPRLTCAR